MPASQIRYAGGNVTRCRKLSLFDFLLLLLAHLLVIFNVDKWEMLFHGIEYYFLEALNCSPMQVFVAVKCSSEYISGEDILFN
jgi:hypothetical protein